MIKDSIEIINLVPKFLDFYNKAIDSDEEIRFELWKKHYGFAAVPPGEEGMRLAKQQLETSWKKYDQVVSYLEQWAPEEERVKEVLAQIKCILKYEEKIDVALIFFVGAFDGNAFAAPYGENRIAVCLPVEEGINQITMVHELIHLVHGKITGFTAGWERPVASLVMQEGLAMQLSKHLVPNHKDEDYVVDQNGWFRSCCMEEQQILQGIKPYLKECSGEKILQFTMGTGTTGKVREGYFAGWKLIGTMLENGMTFAEIARIKETEMAYVLEQYI